MRKLSISTIIHSLTSSLHLPCLTRSLPSPLCFSYLRSCPQLKSSTCQFSHFPLQFCSELVCWPFFPPSLCYHPLHNYPHTAKQLLWLQKYLQIYNKKKTGNDTNNFTITSFPTHHSKIVKKKKLLHNSHNNLYKIPDWYLAPSPDLNATFTTIPHNILLHALTLIGITGIPLDWFKSYFFNCTQPNSLRSAFPTTPRTTGVPQGSVLGPVLFFFVFLIIYLLLIINILVNTAYIITSTWMAHSSNSPGCLI